MKFTKSIQKEPFRITNYVTVNSSICMWMETDLFRLQDNTTLLTDARPKPSSIRISRKEELMKSTSKE